MEIEDSWYWMIAAIADAPTEIEHVLDNWTHLEIARQYAIKVAKSAPTEK